MPRVEAGRTTSDPREFVNRPGEEDGRSEHPPETVLEHTIITSGPKGDQGDQGLPGPGATQPYHHVQSIAAAEWQIAHNRHQSELVATFRDENGVPMFARYDVMSPDLIVVSFPAPQLGTADLIF